MNGLGLVTYEADAQHDVILPGHQLTNGMVVLIAEPGHRHWCETDEIPCRIATATANQFCTVQDIALSREDGIYRFNGLYTDGRLRPRATSRDTRWIVRKLSMPDAVIEPVHDTPAALAPGPARIRRVTSAPATPFMCPPPGARYGNGTVLDPTSKGVKSKPGQLAVKLDSGPVVYYLIRTLTADPKPSFNWFYRPSSAGEHHPGT